MYSQVLQKSKPQVCFFLKTFLVDYTCAQVKVNFLDQLFARYCYIVALGFFL